MEVRVGPPSVTIHDDDEFLVCELNGEMSSSKEQGYFASDTRFVSGYRLKLGRVRPMLCNASAVEHHSARFEFVNAESVGGNGLVIPEQSLHLRLDRTIGHGLHEDYELTNYCGQVAVLELEVSLESDFADLFDVKNRRTIRRGSLQSQWDTHRGRLVTRYRNGEFERSLTVAIDNADSDPQFANGGIVFEITLAPGASWHTCLLWRPALGHRRPERRPRVCHDLIGTNLRDQSRERWMTQVTKCVTSDPTITDIVRQATGDLASLRMTRHDEAASGGRSRRQNRGEDSWVPAAGIPWFLSLFGRDALTVSLQTMSLSPRFALGSLRALASLQADGYDDDRDMQPGKIEHEIRQGELAALRLIPHTPYYGSHEATSLYVLVAAQAWAWHGDRQALDSVRPNVERALSWIDTDGDLDGDGLQEYQTRSAHGYYNQGWKDAGDAIVGADGALASLPIALCEHQSLVVAAKRSWASVLETVYRDAPGATRLRAEADRLVEALETRFWWEEQGTYYLGLDGDKQPIASVTSNPGHLMWHRAVSPERAASVARRLLAPDMWTGWGIRTLSADHPRYNPFSYQLGSVWPHDNVIAAAGFSHYGLDDQAAQVGRGLLDAAHQFTSHRLPELFAGLDRDPGGFPVQYLGANVPQAWAAGAVIQLISVFLGLEADAPARSLVVRPALPDWLPRIQLEHLVVGNATIDLTVTRQPDATHTMDVGIRRGHLEVRLG
ncbi:MAG: glycogen debranching N-terminal domain-containing protein [Acidimicrobiales bacterium]|nr:glycogen debranching N-terminal domain-containing protein [Acidimicrobiales bacterium]